MNSDEIAALVRALLNTALTSGTAAAYVNGQQAAAIATGAGTLVVVLWGVYARWNQRQVPETAIVTGIAPSVAAAKAASTVGVK